MSGTNPDTVTQWRRLRRTLRLLAIAVALLIIAKALSFQSMVAAGSTDVGPAAADDISMRRRYLLEKVATPEFGPSAMPSLVASPYREELAISTLSMTTVALTNIAFRDPGSRNSARDAIRIMISRMLSAPIRQYDVLWWKEDAIASLDSANGHIGYLAHLNLMLGCYRLVGGRDDDMRQLFEEVSSTIARRLAARGTYYAESFPGWTYTADNVIAVLSLRIHDMLLYPAYAELVQKWLAFSRKHLLDRQTGMLRYYVSPGGEPTGTARGVLQAWNSMWLPMIDDEFGRDQYRRMQLLLLARSGAGNFAAVREYPRGVTGPTDLLSGPLIAGLSPSATGFAIGGAALWSDTDTLRSLLRTVEAGGTTVSWNGRRWYLASPLLGDAILLAARTMTRYDARYADAR